MTSRVCIPLATLFLASATIAHSQDTRALRDRAVPVELVEALLSTTRSALPPSISVGEVPPPMQGNVFVPPGARVLGGSFSSSGAVVVMQVSQEPMVVERLLRAEHGKMGWKSLPVAGANGGGFRDASGAGNAGVMCKSGASLNVQITQLRAGESRIRMSSDADGLCSMMDRAAASSNSGDPFANIAWPVLVNPIPARGFGDCPQVRAFGGMQSADLSSSTPLADLLTHYVKQLADSGWTKAGGEAMIQSFSRKDPTTGRNTLVRVVGETYDGFPLCRRMSLQTGVAR